MIDSFEEFVHLSLMTHACSACNGLKKLPMLDVWAMVQKINESPGAPFPYESIDSVPVIPDVPCLICETIRFQAYMHGLIEIRGEPYASENLNHVRLMTSPGGKEFLVPTSLPPEAWDTVTETLDSTEKNP